MAQERKAKSYVEYCGERAPAGPCGKVPLPESSFAYSMRRLNKSASEPGLGGSQTLQQAAAANVFSAPELPSNLYETMKEQGLFNEKWPSIPPAGRSTTLVQDSAARDLQSDIYYPLPATPVHERKFRKPAIPGEVTVHHGLKQQKLPHADFRYGARSVTGQSAEATLQAGLKMGIEEYKQSVKERVYKSTKMEPLGKAFIRGHTLHMLPQGFGNPSGEPEDCKKVIFPVDRPIKDSEEARQQYLKTHQSWDPGEQMDRKYNWPEESKGDFFRFGIGSVDTVKDGAGAKAVLNHGVEDDGTYKRTVLRQRAAEDFRRVNICAFSAKTNLKQGPSGPKVPLGHAYGIKSITSDCTARSCILGYYSLQEQLPDQDLGRCMKPGRRNLTTEARAFGVPSVRTDLVAPPPGKKSVANMQNYGDEFGGAALLHPQAYEHIGVSDQEFLLRRPKEELRSLIAAGGDGIQEVDFDLIWDEAQALFQDDLDLVSLDAFLYMYSNKIDTAVHEKHAIRAPLLKSSSSPALPATC
eukprot:gnl/TRDRNA2_/TRDRNA2_178668_c0_seq1.p1 gnl/TRDRNA2_/TRDRNA2_178668_c0~~gnl/TRDRNA2_/TRDRNA2_178668_c0_seq1.p1  ORF type:complete len:561 (-),score=109.49 gnl/TRDRNA2_/TRDRNA2_178668_c0_seq1:120-1694(-)